MEDKLRLAQEAAIGFVRRMKPTTSRRSSTSTAASRSSSSSRAIARARAGIRQTIAERLDLAAQRHLHLAQGAEEGAREGVGRRAPAGDRRAVGRRGHLEPGPYEEVLDLAKRSEMSIYAIGLRPRSLGARGFPEAEFVLQAVRPGNRRAGLLPDRRERAGRSTPRSPKSSRPVRAGLFVENPRRDGQWRRIDVRLTNPAAGRAHQQGISARSTDEGRGMTVVGRSSTRSARCLRLPLSSGGRAAPTGRGRPAGDRGARRRRGRPHLPHRDGDRAGGALPLAGTGDAISGFVWLARRSSTSTSSSPRTSGRWARSSRVARRAVGRRGREPGVRAASGGARQPAVRVPRDVPAVRLRRLRARRGLGLTYVLLFRELKPSSRASSSPGCRRCVARPDERPRITVGWVCLTVGMPSAGVWAVAGRTLRSIRGSQAMSHRGSEDPVALALVGHVFVRARSRAAHRLERPARGLPLGRRLRDRLVNLVPVGYFLTRATTSDRCVSSPSAQPPDGARRAAGVRRLPPRRSRRASPRWRAHGRSARGRRALDVQPRRDLRDARAPSDGTRR